MLRRAAREHRRWIGDGSPNHRRYYHIEYASPLFTRALLMCRRCVWDIFGLDVHRRMFADCSALFRNISPMLFGVETSGENFNACIEFFLDVPIPWRSMAITHVRRRSFAEPLAHGGAALAMPKCVHCESIGRLKKPRGTVAGSVTSHSRPNVTVRKHGTITQCCFHLGPASKTVGQH